VLKTRDLKVSEWVREHDEASGFLCLLFAMLSSDALIAFASPSTLGNELVFALSFAILTVVFFITYVSVMLRWVRGYWGP
jgi:hypothetical protein